MRFEDNRDLRDSLEREQTTIPQTEELPSPKVEPQVGSQRESHTGGKKPAQEDG